MPTPEERRAYSAAWYARRKEAGLCVCGRKARLGKATCGNHKNDSLYHANYRKACLARGVCCSHPDRPVKPGNSRCVECQDQKIIRQRQRRKERRAAGMCSVCGKLEALPGKARCDRCRALRKQNAGFRRTKKEIAAIMIRCTGMRGLVLPAHLCAARHTTANDEAATVGVEPAQASACFGCPTGASVRRGKPPTSALIVIRR